MEMAKEETNLLNTSRETTRMPRNRDAASACSVFCYQFALGDFLCLEFELKIPQILLLPA